MFLNDEEEEDVDAVPGTPSERPPPPELERRLARMRAAAQRSMRRSTSSSIPRRRRDEQRQPKDEVEDSKEEEGAPIGVLSLKDDGTKDITAWSRAVSPPRHETERDLQSRGLSPCLTPKSQRMVSKRREEEELSDSDSDAEPVIQSREKVVPGILDDVEDEIVRATDLSRDTLRETLIQPPPVGKKMMCYIMRKKKRLGGTKYYMSLQDGDVFLMSARRRRGKKTASYLVSDDGEDMRRNSDHFLGKLRSNFLGTEFHLYDNGENPFRSSAIRDHVRKELGVVLYEPNVVKNKGPRKMTVMIPRIGRDGTLVEWQPTDEDQTMLAMYKTAELGSMITCRNKEPAWNEKMKAFVLNFSGRVTKASVKNFQLIDPEEPSIIIMQFGKVENDVFTIDFQFPMCALQAFLIALSSFDHKLAIE